MHHERLLQRRIEWRVFGHIVQLKGLQFAYYDAYRNRVGSPVYDDIERKCARHQHVMLSALQPNQTNEQTKRCEDSQSRCGRNR